MDQSEFEAITCSSRQTRKNEGEPVGIKSDFHVSGVSLTNRSLSEVKKIKFQTTFDTN